MMDHILTSVDALAEMERRRIVSKYGAGYHSLHEGYAVLLEEVEEAEEDMLQVRDALNRAWECVRADNDSTALAFVHRAEIYARELAAEAVQVMAVAQRMRGGAAGVKTPDEIKQAAAPRGHQPGRGCQAGKA